MAMKKSKYESLWESHKHDKIFSDAVGVSLDRLQKENIFINSTDNEVSRQSTRLGAKIFDAIKNIRKTFLMKEKLKELDVKLKENKEEMSRNLIIDQSIDHQQVSVTLEEHQKTAVTQISRIDSVVIGIDDDHTSNNLENDEKVDEHLTIDEEKLREDNNDNNKVDNNTSPAVNLSENITQQSTTGGIKRKVMDNDNSLQTKPNKRPCVVETSTSMETNQQPGQRCISAPKSNELDEKTLDSSLQNKQNDSHQYHTDKEKNALKPTTRLHTSRKTDDSETRVLYSKVRSILNKLTTENIDKLTQQVKDLNIKSRERLQGVVDLMYDKAIDEPTFAAIYAMMCKKLVDMKIDVDDMRQENKTDFRILLLARCKHEFDNMNTVDKIKRDAKLQEIKECNGIEKKKKLTTLLDDADRRLCKKSVGNIRLIGELFKQDMLKIVVIDGCIERLLATPDENNIECVCKLLTTVGAKLENSEDNHLNRYFSKMTEIAKRDEKIKSRVKYMLQDVIDLRARNWKPKGDESNAILINQFNNNRRHQRKANKPKNSRKRTARLQTSSKTDDSETQKLYNNVRSILNRLTPHNIDKMVDQVKDLNIKSHEILQGVVDIIYDKAIDDTNNAAVYAIMCEKLSVMKIDVVDMRQENDTDFKILLLARCKHEFECAFIFGVARRDKLNALLNNADRRKAVGNVRLIGELFKQNMLEVSVIHSCINDLLAMPVDYNIECLCQLLTTIGANLVDSNWYLSRMTELARCDEKISSRDRCYLQDVISRITRNWKPISNEANQISMDQYNNHKEKNSRKATTCLQITDSITDDSKTQEFYKKVRVILNKLTLENVDKLTHQVRSLNIKSHERLQSVIDLVFEKIIDEPHSATVYAIMCEKLRSTQIFDDDKKQGKCSIIFQSLLSVRCENEFDKLKRRYDIQKKKELTALLNDADRRLYMKSVGFFIFIGELFNREVIRKKFLEKCANYLLTIPNEKNIECLCELLKTTGAKLENFKDTHFNRCFSRMTSLARNEKQSSKVRYMLQNIIDLKAQHWKPRRDEDNTINQISEEGAPPRKEHENIEGGLQMETTSNDLSVPTEINKRPCDIATSTPMEINQQASIQLPGSNDTDATTDYRSDDKTLDMHSDQLPSQEPEPTTTSQSPASLLYVLYSRLDEQIKSLINIPIDQINSKIDHLNYPEFISRSLEVTMLESTSVRDKYWSFVASMITNDIFPLDLFQSEYDKMFREVEDISPKLWTYRAEILKTLVICGAHPLKELKRTTSVLKNIGSVGKLVGELLRLLEKSEGPSAITDKWISSGIEWTDLVDTSLENPDDIVEQYNLQFLSSGKTDPLNEQLLKLLREGDFHNITSWITETIGKEKSRIPKLVRIIFTLILESAIETENCGKKNFYQPNRLKIKKLLPLMKYYIDGNLESELQCLYALTNVNHRCRNPPGFAYDIIEELHEKDIISVGAFNVWHSGTADTSKLMGHDEAVWNLLSQSFWINFSK